MSPSSSSFVSFVPRERKRRLRSLTLDAHAHQLPNKNYSVPPAPSIPQLYLRSSMFIHPKISFVAWWQVRPLYRVTFEKSFLSLSIPFFSIWKSTPGEQQNKKTTSISPLLSFLFKWKMVAGDTQCANNTHRRCARGNLLGCIKLALPLSSSCVSLSSQPRSSHSPSDIIQVKKSFSSSFSPPFHRHWD